MGQLNLKGSMVWKPVAVWHLLNSCIEAVFSFFLEDRLGLPPSKYTKTTISVFRWNSCGLSTRLCGKQGQALKTLPRNYIRFGFLRTKP